MVPPGARRDVCTGGRFSIPGVPAGGIHLNVYDGPGAFLTTGTVRLEDGATASINFEIMP